MKMYEMTEVQYLQHHSPALRSFALRDHSILGRVGTMRSPANRQVHDTMADKEGYGKWPLRHSEEQVAFEWEKEEVP